MHQLPLQLKDAALHQPGREARRGRRLCLPSQLEQVQDRVSALLRSEQLEGDVRCIAQESRQ
jgi:hypothetical protein